MEIDNQINPTFHINTIITNIDHLNIDDIIPNNLVYERSILEALRPTKLLKSEVDELYRQYDQQLEWADLIYVSSKLNELLILQKNFPSELLIRIGEDVTCILRGICRRWRSLLPVKCLKRSYTHYIVEQLKQRYIHFSDVEPHLWILR